jgi:type IV pilus assembly protein PilA
MRKKKGFSLIELLIVVAIILIIAAIAVPSLLRSRMLANESSAASTTRTLNTAEATYASTWNQGYAGAITNLGGTVVPCVPAAATACLIDPVLSASDPAPKQGYDFSAAGLPTGAGATAATPNTDFVTAAVPITVGTSGKRTFCSSAAMVIYVDLAGGAAPASVTACSGFTVLQNQ